MRATLLSLLAFVGVLVSVHADISRNAPIIVGAQRTAFVPTQLSGLVRWYDASQETGADDSTLATWTDRSGSGVNATSIGTPKLRTSVQNGRNVVRFDNSSNCHYTLTNASGTTQTTFAVVKSTSTNYRAYLNVNAALTSFQGFTTSGTYGLGAPSQRANNRDDNETVDANGDGVATNLWYICTWNRSGATRTYRTNGVLRSRTASTIVAGDTFSFGGIGGNGSFQWVGDIAEIGSYNRSLTEGEESWLVSELAKKWFSKQVVADGNSLTRGFPDSTGSDSYPSLMQTALGNTYTVVNLGVDGQTIAQMHGDFNTQVRPLRQPYAKSVYIAWEFANSIKTIDATTAIDQFKQLCNSARAAGMLVVAVTITGATNGGLIDATWQTRRDTSNTWLRDSANLVANGGVFHVLADPALDAAILTSWGTANPTYYADQIHFNDAGYALVAPYMTAAVQTAYTMFAP